ncbi:MAG: DUF3795 domain-containing protein [Promethearchaeia archaeon]
MTKENHAGYCGIFCNACPLFQVEKCQGCKSAKNTHYKDSNPKWECEVRKCAVEKEELEYCCECPNYPCTALIKFRNTHLTESKYEYRHKIFYNLTTIVFIGPEKWIEEQDELWRCPNCGGRVVFLNDKCIECGVEVKNIYRVYVREHDNKFPDL